MKVAELNSPIQLTAVPRVVPCMGEFINIFLTNTETNLSFELPVFWTYEKQRLFFSFEFIEDFKSGNTYFFSLKKEELTIYMGSLLIVKENTNLQNYDPSNQKPQRFKTKEV